ncbi:TRAP transporter small permease [Pollutimonas harenae]|uniref:TRAP transporter small permease protein n=1 Tax=Pollutimonas harenae TaxID=657015 RepID=A0A853H303_9BURK|nr:TRAP transporter small permease [Pollutimonas harenae]NYT84534.1 TRAP transporter small permease [Pollutimonas harenae]TEA73072.1 TRAP transporter small permease [Pollutimonas harenae]
MSSPNPSSTEPIEPVIPEVVDPPVKVPLKIEDWISVLVLAILALITFANVVVRYTTDQSFAWTEEISVFLLIVLTMTAGATAFVRNQHIRIELFADGGTPRRRRRLALISYSLVLAFFVLLTVLSARMALDEFNWGDTSPAIGVPTWWYSMWMPVLAFGISLRIAGMLRRLLREPA